MIRSRAIQIFLRSYVALMAGALLFFLLAYIFGDEELFGEFANSLEIVTFILFPLITLVALSIGLRYPRLGGAVVLLSMAALFILRPDLMKSVYLLAVVLAGVGLVVLGRNAN